MNAYKLHHGSLLFLVLVLTANPLDAQDQANDTTGVFSIKKGAIVSGFSLGWTNASRDDYNHEFERAFSRVLFNIEGLYFLNDHVGIGPVLGYHYLYRELQDLSDPDDFRDLRDWSVEYGLQAGWYAPVKKLFNTASLGDSYLFLDGGLSWLRETSNIEPFGKTDPNTRFGYQLSTGFLIPIGPKIALEGKLKWEARQRHYIVNIIDRNGDIIRTIDETYWPSVLSLGIGLKVVF